ncbi:unnamed protein product [Ixodes hexagonus]
MFTLCQSAPRRRKRLFWLLSACSSLYVLTLLSFRIEPSSSSFHEFHKCPACYGDGLCPLLQNLELEGWSSRTALRRFNVKNVFFGEWNNTRVVAKKLAHDTELVDADSKLCRPTSHRCNVAAAMRDKLGGGDPVAALLSFMSSVRTDQDITACPSRRLVRRVLSAVEANFLAVAHRKGGLNPAQVVAFTASVNPEPLILQAFPRREGWPFPEFHGSCGRVVVESYEGRPLSHFESSDWLVRAHLANQLLGLAQLLTENPTEFALYLTDVSMDNFAVDATGRVTVIDVENVVVVDRKEVKEGHKTGWDRRYEHLEEACHDCLSFSSEDLCSHHLADHNHFAVCSGLLAPRAFYSSAGGLLHSVPADVERQHNLSALLAACDRPLGHNQTRFEAASKLRKALISVLEGLPVPAWPSAR